MPAPTPLRATAPKGRCYCRDRISPEKGKRRPLVDPELPDRPERRAGDSRYCCLSVKHQNGVFTLFPSRPNPPREIPTCEELGPKASAHYVLDLCLLRYLLFHPAGQQEPTEGTEAEAIRVNARENRVTAAAGVSPTFAPSAPLGGHGWELAAKRLRRRRGHAEGVSLLRVRSLFDPLPPVPGLRAGEKMVKRYSFYT